MPKIRPTEVGRSFKSGLHGVGTRFEYHPRKWVDHSSPAYMESGRGSNTTHGSGWIIQVEPTWRRGVVRVLATGVGGLFKSGLHGVGTGFEYHPRKWVDHSSPAYMESGRGSNTTHGSG